MAFTLISIFTLATTALAVPLADIQQKRDVDCKSWYKSQPGDTCRSIGLGWGYYDTDIQAANGDWLNCDDIWDGELLVSFR